MIASVRLFETPKIRAVSKGVAGRLLSTLIGCRMWLLYAGVPHVSRLLRDVGLHGPVPLRIGERHNRERHDFSRAARRQ
jgi:hypothetical protein